MYNLRPFFISLQRMRDNHGRGPMLTVVQGMQFASVRLSCEKWVTDILFSWLHENGNIV